VSLDRDIEKRSHLERNSPRWATASRSATKVTKITKITRNFVVFVFFEAFVPEREAVGRAASECS
jgi:hypothetical protein